MSIELQILKMLSPGHFVSGESLAKALGVSRTTVWKGVQKAQQQFDIEIYSVKGRGYCLSQAIELLDSKLILEEISSFLKKEVLDIDIIPVVDSSNRYLVAAASQGAPSGKLILAEQQTAGHGRLGRTWISPFGCNIYCSLLWRFDMAVNFLSGLGIMAAIAIATALSEYVEDIQIKWPNDILCQGRKLAGILLEMQGEANGPAAVVIGFGVNVNMPVLAGEKIDQDWTDILKAGGKLVSRNTLTAKIIQELVMAIKKFEVAGLSGFISNWPQWDMLANQPIDIVMANHTISGTARGIDETGALRVESGGVVKSYMAGEASIRKKGSTCQENQ